MFLFSIETVLKDFVQHWMLMLDCMTRGSQASLKVENKTDLEETTIPFLLPHELFDALHKAGKYQVGITGFDWVMFLKIPPIPFEVVSHYRFVAPTFLPFHRVFLSLSLNPWALQFNLSMTCGRSGHDFATFWRHCFKHEEWMNHPAKYLDGVVLERIFHALVTEKNTCNPFISNHLTTSVNPRIGASHSAHRRGRVLQQFRVLCVELGVSVCNGGGGVVWPICIPNIWWQQKLWCRSFGFMQLQVWDVKFPIAIVPHSWMSNKRVSTLACGEFGCQTKGFQP